MPVWVAVAELPARSLQLAVADRALPSPLVLPLAVGVAGPDSASLQVQVTVTSLLFQPAALAAGFWIGAVRVGLVRSMLIPPWLAEAVLPATSVQVPLAVWPAPSSSRTSAMLALTAPEVSSSQFHMTVTAALFQPSPLAAGARLRRLIPGAVLSNIRPKLAPWVLPASSVHEPLTSAVAESGPL